MPLKGGASDDVIFGTFPSAGIRRGDCIRGPTAPSCAIANVAETLENVIVGLQKTATNLVGSFAIYPVGL
jgi:hypothetical protein